MNKPILSILILVGIVTTGCGGFSSPSAKGMPSLAPLDRSSLGTCDRSQVATINLCTEAVGADYNEPSYLEILRSSCESSGGVFSTDTCNPAESFGTCVVGQGASNLTYVTYYAPAYTNTSAQEACETTAGGVYYPR